MRLAALGLLVAFMTSLGAMPASAQGTGTGAVNVYNWEDYTVPAQLQAFTRTTGISVDSTTYTTNELLDAKLRSGQWNYDVVVPTATPFFARQVAAGLFQKLDKSKLPHWNNLAPDLLAALAKYDPGNAYGMPYAWGTIGIGYDIAEVRRRLPNAPVDSLGIVFDPAIVAKFTDCGVTVLDSPSEIVPAALRYLGLDPNSHKPADLARAQKAIDAIRPYVRDFESSAYIRRLGTGKTCLALAYSGGIYQAMRNAGDGKVGFARPKEGALMWIDVAAIPKNAPNPGNAHRFLDFLLDPEVAAAWTTTLGYATPNRAALDHLPAAVRDGNVVYPSAHDRARLYMLSDEPTSSADTLWDQLMLPR